MDENRPARRWYQFSLRELLIVVTLLCLWLGYSVNWIRQRQDFRAVHSFWEVTYVNGSPDAPALLWVFGERAADAWDAERLTDEERKEARRLFPEADIISIRVPY
jgi:hypothetical protein